MRSRGLTLVAAVLIAASPAMAQSLRGTVLDSASGLPLAGAHVTVLDAHDSTVAGVVTGVAGTFSFQLGGFGSYRVRARRIGYASRITQAVAVDSLFAYTIEIVLLPNPVPLDTLTVVAENVAVEQRAQWLVDNGFFDRRREGFGHFLTRKDIEEKIPRTMFDVLRGTPGVEVHGSAILMPAAASMFFGVICAPSVVLDGVTVSVGGSRGNAGLSLAAVNPFDVEGVEIYTSPAGLPVQYSGYLSPCGAILIWTRHQ